MKRALLALPLLLGWLGHSGWSQQTSSAAFVPSFTNTNPVGANFAVRLYSNSATYTNSLTSRVVFSAGFVGASLQTNTNAAVPVNLVVAANGLVTNGIFLNPATGLLFGRPTTNFILTLPLNSVAVTNISQTNPILNLTNITTNATNRSTNTNTTYKFYFPAQPRVTFTNTNMLAFTTNNLPTTNSNGLTHTYAILRGPASILSSTQLVSAGPGVATIRVGLLPDALGLFTGATNIFYVNMTSAPAAGPLAFTNTNGQPFTATNLPYLGVFSFGLTNIPAGATVTLGVNPPSAGRLFVSNGITNFQSLAGSGTSSVIAVAGSTPTNTAITNFISITNSRATSTISWVQPPAATFWMSNANTTFTNQGVGNTNVQLAAIASSGAPVVFSSANEAVAAVTNGNTLVLKTSGSSVITATPVGEDPALYAPNSSNRTATVVREIFFTSTNRTNGTVGVTNTNFLTLSATNGLTNALTFVAANLAPGLALVTSNLGGTVTNAGLYRMTLTASNNLGDTGTTNLLSLFTNASPFANTDPWFFRVSLGVGTNTNGTYELSYGTLMDDTNQTFLPVPSEIVVATNTNALLPGSLILSNGSANFVGRRYFQAIYTYTTNQGTNTITNRSTNFFPLEVVLAPPILSYTLSNVSGALGQSLSVSPASLVGTNASQYPLQVSATNLPPGLVVNPTNGVITGQATAAGVYSALLWATNRSTNNGGSSATSTIVFNITARSVAGSPLRLPLAGLFSNPTAPFAVSGLPPGVNLDAATGLLTGVPQAPGVFPLVIGSSGTTNTYSLQVLPPAPILQLPTTSVTATRGSPFYLQPWVTGAGWEWAGQDPLTNRFISTRWDYREATNGNGALRPLAVSGLGTPLSYSNRSTNLNHLSMGWPSRPTHTNLLPTNWPAAGRVPVATPWLAQIRVQNLQSVSAATGYLENYLGISTLASNQLPSTNAAEVSLLNTNGGQAPAGLLRGATNVTNSMAAIPFGTEIGLRLTYLDNHLSLQVSTNLNATNYIPVLVLSNATNVWGVTNPLDAFGLRIAAESLGQATPNNQMRFRHFVVQPAGLVFSASNLPTGLSIDPISGTVFGTPNQRGTNVVTVTVSNGQGFSQRTLRIVVQ